MQHHKEDIFLIKYAYPPFCILNFMFFFIHQRLLKPNSQLTQPLNFQHESMHFGIFEYLGGEIYPDGVEKSLSRFLMTQFCRLKNTQIRTDTKILCKTNSIEETFLKNYLLWIFSKGDELRTMSSYNAMYALFRFYISLFIFQVIEYIIFFC